MSNDGELSCPEEDGVDERGLFNKKLYRENVSVERERMVIESW